MNKGLEALERIINLLYHFPHGTTLEQDEQIDNDRSTVEKELKVLEIIKTKQVDIKWCGGLPPLLQQTYSISKEEFDLLKEVFL